MSFNGCGPDWIKIAPLEYKCCQFHDIAYTLGLLPRKEIDKRFLKQMLKEKPDKKIWAYTYYILVRLFGWIYYKK